MYCFHFIIKKIHGIYNNQERFCDLKTKSHWLWWIRMNPCSFFSKSPFFLWTIALCNKRLILILSISDQDDFHPWLRKESNISPFPSQESTETCTDLPGILRGTRPSASGAQFVPRNHFISSVHIQYVHSEYIIQNYRTDQGVNGFGYRNSLEHSSRDYSQIWEALFPWILEICIL